MQCRANDDEYENFDSERKFKVKNDDGAAIRRLLPSQAYYSKVRRAASISRMMLRLGEWGE